MRRTRLEPERRVGGGHVVEQLVAVLAHERLLVIAPDVVPRDPVAVHVVEHAQARLDGAVDVELGVVRLRFLLVAALAPRHVRPTGRRLVGGRDLAARRRPEPSVHALRFQVGPVLAALEVAQPSAGPYVRRVICTRNTFYSYYYVRTITKLSSVDSDSVRARIIYTFPPCGLFEK